MKNPFDLIESRLNAIEALLLEIKHKSNRLDKNSNRESDLLTVEQAAQFLHLSKSTVYTLMSKGELPHMKRSKRCYFSRAELTTYIKNGKKQTNQELKLRPESYVRQPPKK